MSAILSALPDLPPLVPAGTTINGKPIRVRPRVNLGDITANNLGTVKKLHNCLFPVSYSDQFYQDSLNLDLSPEDCNKLIFYQDLAVGVLISRIEPCTAASPTDLDQAVSQPTAEQNDRHQDAFKLYIMTLGVLAPYRNQGLASKLIHHLIASASQTLNQPAAPEPALAPELAPVVQNEPESTRAPALSKKALKKAAQKGKTPAPPPVPTTTAAAKPEQSTVDPVDAEKERKKQERAAQEAKRSRRRIEKLSCHVQVGNDQGRQFWEKFGFKVVETVPDYYRKIEPRDAWLMERPVVAPTPVST
ncbi:peptide alpha-N-acetyltransferase subunit NAT5 [Sporobolomyces koalae]|uniref:peptide alpha-N-acetyltransferase subunit NAT5 n=1 Tax=Sporobolomyces koalae TaxID=500713 RepID=UPI003178F046